MNALHSSSTVDLVGNTIQSDYILKKEKSYYQVLHVIRRQKYYIRLSVVLFQLDEGFIIDELLFSSSHVVVYIQNR